MNNPVATAAALAVLAVPVYYGGKLVSSITSAKTAERVISTGALGGMPMPHDAESSHWLWGYGERIATKGMVRAFGQLAETLGPVYVFRGLNETMVMVSDPEIARTVMVKYNLPKGKYDSVHELVGDSLLTTSGDVWAHKRKAVNPAFRVSFLQAVVVPTVLERGTYLFDTVLQSSAANGTPVDLQEWFSRVTLDVIGIAGFGHNFDFTSHPDSSVSAMVLTVLDEPNFRATNPLRPISNWRETRAYHHALAEFRALGAKVVAEARARQANGDTDANAPKTILDLLLAQSDMSEQSLRSEIMTFLLAGHETTASTLSFMIQLLDANPEFKQKVFHEVDDVLGRDRLPTFEDLSKLKWVTAVMKETLRLFPIGWATARKTVEETQLGEYIVPPNVSVIVDFMHLHRNPRIWPNPLAFDPSRFMTSLDTSPSESVDDKATGQVPYSYLPFAGGLRSCIGKPFAEIEIKLLVAMFAQRFDWKVQRPEEWGERPLHDLYKDGTTLRPLPHTVVLVPRA
ncbi:hypothetical protein AMAG_17145 [Allomyces macrogynus ATCC 38327]|uniref:Cytochrome P450 n=1 Tax=Allomyces macrogynus (strain ATCC 38327) TaxID=578462 RepID=A0A0L0TDU0_ALLM3|nr:hypothetical protein AMAG_17145 [Allomyces macrogynus ATCC 38327]|eukprot:KNE72907.1 hypothetical protein AMAG_17145 [Allomyces macrogynus ATCC 38327]